MSDIYGQLRTDLFANARQWREIDYETYEWRIECVPPVMGGYGACLCGEPYCDSADGQAIYFAVIERGGKYYATYATRKEWRERLIPRDLGVPFPSLPVINWAIHANTPA